MELTSKEGKMANFCAKSLSEALPDMQNSNFLVNTLGATITADSDEMFSASALEMDSYFSAQSGTCDMKTTLPTCSPVTAVFVTSGSKDKAASYYKYKLESRANVADIIHTIRDKSLLVALA